MDRLGYKAQTILSATYTASKRLKDHGASFMPYKPLCDKQTHPDYTVCFLVDPPATKHSRLMRFSCFMLFFFIALYRIV